MVKLGLRRPSTLTRTRRRASDESSMSIGASGHSDCSSPVDFPSVVKDAGGIGGSAHSRRDGLSRSGSIASMMSVDTIKASGSNMRKSFKASRKSSFLSKSFRKSFLKSVKGEKETTFRLDGKSGDQIQYVARSGGSRRTSTSPTVVTMGTTGSVAAAAAAVRNHHDSGDFGDDDDEGALAVNLAPKQMSSGRGGRRASAVRGRRTTLGSIPDGIDLIEDPDGDDDRTVGDRSNCSDLSGLTGLVSNQHDAGDFDCNVSLSSIPSVKHSNSGGKRGSIRIEISRPAAQGRRRSSLIRIPDGITLVQMSASGLEEGDLGMSSEFDASLESLKSATAGLDASLTRLTIEEGKKEEASSSSSSSEESSASTNGEVAEPTKAEATTGPGSPEEAAVAPQTESEAAAAPSPSPVVSSILSMDHRLHAQRASERRALFEGGGDNEDPRLMPPAFPALAEFVASLSSTGNGLSAPVNIDPSASGPRPPSPTSFLGEEREEERAAPVRSSRSVLDELLKPSRARQVPPPNTKPSAPDHDKEEKSWSLSAALDCIQGEPSSRSLANTSSLDRLLGDMEKKRGNAPSALDRLLAPPPPSGEPRPWERKLGGSSSVIDDLLRGRPPVTAAATGQGSNSASVARHASSAIDRILSSRPNANGRKPQEHAPRRTPAATGLSALGINMDNYSPRSPHQLSEAASARSKKARCA